jgi:hypothetical protein
VDHTEANLFDVVAEHTYEETGTTSLSVSVQDVGGASASSVSSTFAVADLPVGLTALNAPPGVPTEG